MLDTWRNLGLLPRIVAAQSVLLVAGVLLMTLLLTHQHRGEVIRDQEARARLVLLLAAPLVAEQALRGDYAAAKQLLERQAAVYADICRLHWHAPGQQDVAVQVNVPIDQPPQWFQRIVDIPVMHRDTPIMLGGVEYGQLQVSLDAQFAHQLVWREFLSNLLLVFWVATGLLAVSLVVLRVNLRVLRDLADVTDRFRQGDHAVRIPPRGARELRSAAAAFNNMAERMQALFAELSTSRQQYHDQLQFIEALIEALPVPMFYKDDAGVYRGVNKAWEELFAMRRIEALGRKVRELDPDAPENAAFHEWMDRQIPDAGVQTYEMAIRTRDGRTRHTMYSKTKLRDANGQTKGLIGIITDLTQLKAVEQQVMEALVAKTAAEEASQAKSLFLANMSHEIRTPLNAVLGLAQIGLRGSKGRQAYEVFARILDSGKHLLGVINDILDFSKMEVGKLAVDSTYHDLGEAIDQAVGITAGRAYAKGLEFVVREPPDLPATVQGDAMRLTQVLVNLLGNAVKFTAQGRVSLDIRRVDDGLEFSVTDSGIGMTPEQLSHLFLPFEQADVSTTRRFGGTGLGLVISKNLVELMGGKISVCSQPGQGSVFRVHLPLRGAPRPPPPAWPGLTLAGLPASEADILQADLRGRGLEVARADSVASALGSPGQGFILLPSEALRETAVMYAALEVLRQGRHLLLAVTPGKSDSLPEDLHWSVHLLDRPLRVRRVLAACATPGAAKLAAGSAGRRLQGVRVLAAEDTEVNRLVLEDLLAQEGATVVFAENGQQALDRVEERGANAFDVVLMDIQMPVMDGYLATRHLRERAPALPVIGLTAHAMLEERERCLAAGMVEHVTKPVDVDKLVAVMRRFLPPVAQAPAPTAPAAPAPGIIAPAAASHASGMVSSPAVAYEQTMLDGPALLARFQGRQAFVDKLLATTLKTHGDLPARMRDAVSRGDLEGMAFIAHGIKGLAGNLLAAEVHALAAETEAAARGRLAEASDLANRLAGALQGLLGEIAGRLDRAGA